MNPQNIALGRYQLKRRPTRESLGKLPDLTLTDVNGLIERRDSYHTANGGKRMAMMPSRKSEFVRGIAQTRTRVTNSWNRWGGQDEAKSLLALKAMAMYS